MTRKKLIQPGRATVGWATFQVVHLEGVSVGERWARNAPVRAVHRFTLWAGFLSTAGARTHPAPPGCPPASGARGAPAGGRGLDLSLQHFGTHHGKKRPYAPGAVCQSPPGQVNQVLPGAACLASCLAGKAPGQGRCSLDRLELFHLVEIALISSSRNYLVAKKAKPQLAW